MLKKKFMSVLLTIAMLMGISAVSVSANSTDAISSVIADTSNCEKWASQWNRAYSSPVNASYTAWGDEDGEDKIGGDENACLKATASSTAVKDGRFHMNAIKLKYDSDGEPVEPDYSSYNIAAATSTIYWSFDVWSNDITNIRMQVGPYKMHDTAVSASQLIANQWNTLAIVYYPDTTEGATTCGYADLYVNGEFVESKSLSSVATTTTQTRVYYDFVGYYAYFDNLTLYEMTSFTRPTIDTSNVTVTDGVITDYVTETRRSAEESKEDSSVKRAAYTISKYDATVKAVETLLGGATVTNADGTEADDDANVCAGMKVKTAPNVIEGVGTFTDPTEYTFSNIAETYVDATDLTSWANGWNRIMGGLSGMTTANEISSKNGTAKDPLNSSNTVAGYKLSGTVGTTVSYIKMAECYWKDASSTASIAIDIGTATTPLYASIDVYDNDVLTDFMWETGGGGDIGTTITKDQLNANAWNTFAVVYYPNLEDTSKLGYADAYLNEKFIGTSDLSGCDAWAYGGEIRLTFKYTAADTTAYFDNHKCYALTEFVRPDITAGSATIANGTLTGYVTKTVAELEAATGANIVNADGTDATATATPVAGMKALTSSTVEGVDTFTNEYVLGAGGYEIADWSYTTTGGVLNAQMPVVNLTGGDVTFTVLVAEYEDTRFVNAEVVPVTITGVTGEAKIENYTFTAGHTYKLFAWESMDTLTPLKNVKTFTE